MNKISKALIAALVFGGSVSTATAAGVITKIEATDTTGGTLDLSSIGTDRNIDLTKTFTSINPITLTFTVEHQSGGEGSPYSILENVVNNTGQAWGDFHYSITEPNQGNGVVFTSHNSSTLSGFTLDGSSGPRNLNFTGSLADGQTAHAAFSISPFDPGNNNQMTFTLTQIPSPIPEPETYAMMLAGLLMMGGIAKRRNNKIRG
jgi:hypothetical protein